MNKRFLPWFILAILLVIAAGGTAYTLLKRQLLQESAFTQAYKILTQTAKINSLLNVSPSESNNASTWTHIESALDSIQNTGSVEAGQMLELRKELNELQLLWQLNNSINSTNSSVNENELVEKIQAQIKSINLIVFQDVNNKIAAGKANLKDGIFFIVAGTVLLLLAILGLVRLVMSENRSRVRAELMLTEKYDELNRINDITKTANILLNGLRQVNNSLMGNDNVEGMVRNFLDTITLYLKAPSAICYLYDQGQGLLLRVGSIAVASGVNQQIRLGDGITGAAATRKTITVIHDIPDNYWQITSGSGNALADTLIILPLWKGNELVGAVELGCFGKDTAIAIELLNGMAANIALGLSGASLLALTQEQRDVLEAQQEELRQTNDELAMQAEILRESEEHLKAQEVELIKMNTELEEKTESLEAARADMQKKAEDLELAGKYKSEFLANMSHELRTPLNSILILTSLMQENSDKNLSRKQIENLGIVHNSGNDLLNLINDILDLSKIEAGKSDFHFESISLRQLAAEIGLSFTAIANGKNIHFTVLDQQLMRDQLVTDRQRLGQVLKNLLSNAFKFTPTSGNVTIEFISESGQVIIRVSDTGIGIPKDKHELIFEAFQQADGATTRRHGGTGLGLSISKELVNKLGGRINMESEEGKGSTFTIELPLSHVVTEAGDLATLPADISEFQQQLKLQDQIKDDRQNLVPQEHAVLIIEDDVNFARTVNDFAIQRGFKTIIALSGDEGLHYARTFRPTAIILDLALPVLSGQHILKIVKSDPNLRHIPVHVISAYDKSEFAAEDASGYVQKPIQQPDLDYTFESIETYISQHYRKVLVSCDPESPLKQLFVTASEKALSGLVYEVSESKKQTLQLIKAGKADCLIIDCSGQTAAQAAALADFREAAPHNLHIISYVGRPLSSNEIEQFGAFSDTVIGQSTLADGRLLDEIELFLRKVGENPRVHLNDHPTTSFDNLLKGKTVLIADDDMRNIFALSALLEASETNVLSAEHGKEALKMLEEHPEIDLVLMDIMMPEMDGYEAMRLIRENKNYADLPVIALTAKAMIGDREKCLEAGASDYITKPVNNNKLLSLLRVWLSANS